MIPIAAAGPAIQLLGFFLKLILKISIGAGIFFFVVHLIEARAVMEREIDLAQQTNKKLIQDVEERDRRNAAHEKRHDSALQRLDSAEAETAQHKQAIAKALAEARAARQSALDAAIASGDDDIDTNPQLCRLDCVLPDF